MRKSIATVFVLSIVLVMAGCNCSQSWLEFENLSNNARVAFTPEVEFFNDGLLIAAGEEDEDDDLDMGMGDTTPAPVTRDETEARRKYFMLRLGAVAPSAGDNATYSATGSVGIGFEAPFIHSETIGLDASFDQITLEATDAGEQSAGMIMTGTIRIAPGGKALYIAGVASIYNETVTDIDTGDEIATNSIMLMGGGIGYRPYGGSYDLRATLNLIPGSENSTGLLNLTGGYLF